MNKATPEEVHAAIRHVLKLREHGQDPEHVAKVLLDYHERLGYLTAVYHAAERYLQSGQGVPEHTALLQTLERARYADAHRAHRDLVDIGLT